MGVKVLQCFPWYRRCKERSKGRQRPPVAPRLSSTASSGSENEGGGGAAGSQVYYSQKARVSFRHQMDGNVNAIDATY
uniref:Si:dkey-85k7.7 n=1 Tax=Paramormyrops kingsleyae TaxID=1676925 RepID=A0A3B3SIE6_9TELE